MIKVEHLSKSFGKLDVLKDISFEMEEGKVLVLIGPSGTGKSTLLRCINYLEKPEKGMITIGEVSVDAENHKKKEIYNLRKQTAMVFQNYSLFKHKTALENIMTPLIDVQKKSKDEAKEKGLEILKAIGLLEKENAYPAHLSGGQQQRIGIGRAMAVNPKVLLIDEPTSSLDPELVGEVLNLLYQLAKQKVTMIIATHEMEFARNIADHVMFMDEGVIIEEGSPDILFSHPKKERTKQFLKKFSKKNMLPKDNEENHV